MNRSEAKELLPIIKAFAEGKEIECRVEDKWYKVLEICNEINPQDYRIKPESKYRPFANAEECWQEMQKHQPFGWVIKHNEGKILIGEVPSDGIVLHNQRGSMFGFDEANRILTFADGFPFGIKEEG